MTEEEKAKRRVLIQETHEPKKAREMTYWITRDRDVHGVLDTTIDVWLARPKLCVLPGGVGVTWICDDITVATAGGDCPARYTQWTMEQCLRACRVYPETERECIKVGD
jgi:hypothetical protein